MLPKLVSPPLIVIRQGLTWSNLDTHQLTNYFLGLIFYVGVLTPCSCIITMYNAQIMFSYHGVSPLSGINSNHVTKGWLLLLSFPLHSACLNTSYGFLLSHRLILDYRHVGSTMT